jgi:dihydropteroate synthase-like protein
MDLDEIIKIADYYHQNGADIIDLGCVNGREFPHLEEVIYSLKEKNYLSIDTFDQDEIIRASKTGIDYLLSINSHNLEVLNYEVNYLPVIIPDPESGNLKSLYKNIKKVKKKGIKNYIVDPILDPINFGFSESLFRYLSLAKDKKLKQEMMMGVGNLIELSDCDSTGLNFIAAALAVELNIEYLLITEASFKTRGAVKELDLALKIISHAEQENSLPNNLSNLLLNLKDRKDRNYTREEVKEIKNSITDSNYRILNDGKAINIFNAEEEYRGRDISELFFELKNTNEPSHAFYLGKELQKAYTALNLSKNYRQEDELDWGYLNSNFKSEKFKEKKNDN